MTQSDTLDSYLQVACDAKPMGALLRSLLVHIAQAGSDIATTLRASALSGVAARLDSINVQGEAQLQLDIQSHQIAESWLRQSHAVAGLVSEEVEQVIDFGEPDAPFVVCMDPLDGSSNLPVNGVVGSIFAILQHDRERPMGEKQFLQPGERIVAAAYLLYGPSTLLVLSVGQGVQMFTLGEDGKSYWLTQQNLNIATQTTNYFINASNARYWRPAVQRYIEECAVGCSGPRASDFNMRWSASMVMDIHRVMLCGGVFLYPQDSKEPLKAGRLRLLYEVNPMSFLIEQAGGLSIDGLRRVLEVVPQSIHQRIPVMLGARDEIQRLRLYHEQCVSS